MGKELGIDNLETGPVLKPSNTGRKWRSAVFVVAVGDVIKHGVKREGEEELRKLW